MVDYSESYLKLQKELNEYLDAMLKRDYEKAFQIGLEMIVDARMLKIVAQDLAE